MAFDERASLRPGIASVPDVCTHVHDLHVNSLVATPEPAVVVLPRFAHLAGFHLAFDDEVSVVAVMAVIVEAVLVARRDPANDRVRFAPTLCIGLWRRTK